MKFNKTMKLVVKKIQERRVIAIGAIAAVAMAAIGFVAIKGLPAFHMPSVVAALRPATLIELEAMAKATPADAGVQLRLGHAYFEAHRVGVGLAAYERALTGKASADGLLVDNAVSCFGSKEQPAASQLIAKHKLVDAEPLLIPLAKHEQRSVRWGAVHTLEKLGRVAHVDYANAYAMDLKSSDCDVKRHAVDKLGEIGTREQAAMVKAMYRAEQENTPWYRSYCVGDRALEVEKKILARATPKVAVASK